MAKPTMIIVLEGGLIQDIFVDGTHEIVVIDHDVEHIDDLNDEEKYVEYLDAMVFDHGTAPLSALDADVMEAVCKHLELEIPNATNGATPPQDSQ